MPAEVECVVPKGRMCSRSSFQMRKSSHNQRTRVADDIAIRSSISSRARLIKDFEGEPFLSVDLLPGIHSNCQSSRKVHVSGPRLTPVKEGHHTDLFISGRVDALNHSDCRGGGLTSDLYTAFVHTARPESFVSLARTFYQPNVRVKMPFKHATNKPASATGRQTFIAPGQALTENTSWAIQVVDQIIQEQKQPQIVYVRGRLLKARLKSLEPVELMLPTIHQCRGIIADTRAYSASGSRTFQKFKTILSRTQDPQDVIEEIEDAQPISKSAHRTSEASSPTPAVDLV